MFAVYMVSPGGVKGDYIRVFENEIDAADFCDVRGWEWCDPDTRFVWNLDYMEV